MVVVDSGVWIDFFNGQSNQSSNMLRRLLAEGDTRIVVPDLVLFEVLRGFRSEAAHRQAQRLMTSIDIESTGGGDLALEAASHDRALRKAGITVRSGIDVLIAAFCIHRDYLLLHRDRDFDALERWRGLRTFRHAEPG